MARTPKTQPPDGPAPGADFKPLEILVIKTPEMLRAVGDPLRLKIMETIRKEALTVKQIATRLGEPATKLYYHVAELEEVGFVVQVDTRVKSGILEKYYRMSAESVTVDSRLLNLAGDQSGGLGLMLTAIFDTTVEDLLRSLQAGLVILSEDGDNESGPFVITRCMYRVRKEKILTYVNQFNELLHQLAEEEEQLETEDEPGDSLSFGCTIAFYPRVETGKEIS